MHFGPSISRCQITWKLSEKGQSTQNCIWNNPTMAVFFRKKSQSIPYFISPNYTSMGCFATKWEIRGGKQSQCLFCMYNFRNSSRCPIMCGKFKKCLAMPDFLRQISKILPSDKFLCPCRWPVVSVLHSTLSHIML